MWVNPNPMSSVLTKRLERRLAQKEDHVGTQGRDDSHIQAKERGLRMKSTLLTP